MEIYIISDGTVPETAELNKVMYSMPKGDESLFMDFITSREDDLSHVEVGSYLWDTGLEF